MKARRRGRARWPIRVHRLGEEPVDVLPAGVTSAERLAIAWRLSLEAWKLSGRELPTYDRAHIPARFFGPGERPPDDD